ncbi:NUMOD4 domain-containing protein [Lacticaseibacillus pabuli]|uniref:NUMOD4 domain-containing protein n=1 Tax=Lacticaseibacillus pabuli TaxID=3025672 RepID=A0ABY7WS34_9LACO|nr:NUMOD4 domain-containing protein [Lacticaseibacillus sp. KACC 23028]WDF81834.1 NUMOD4 domain-containing protein [Lacticaseibacillus sp. KACC 23028]
MIEEWRDIEGYEGLYQVSSFGHIKNAQRNWILKPKFSHGYAQTLLYKNKKGHTIAIHRLVAKAFLPNPGGLPQINHLDENKANNRVDNLEWCSAKHNINYGTHNERVLSHDFIARPVIATSPDGAQRLFDSQREACRFFGLTTRCVWSCLHGLQKTTHGYSFMFA